MKKLSKKFNLKKVSLEAYNVYGCSGCSSYCGTNMGSRYQVFKAAQIDDIDL
jgi:putative bacteriocin precursor